MQKIHEIVKAAEDNYVQGTTTISKFVNWSMFDTINTIDAYINSKHLSGPTDSLEREKPFFNIVTAAVNIWYRATDIDRKNIRLIAKKSRDIGINLIATVHLNEWMKKSRFGVFLNEWGRTLSKYGSAVVKFVEQDGELFVSVIPWNRFVADPIDFDAIPHIEKFYKTPEQLRMMPGYDQDAVDNLITTLNARKLLDGTTSQDTNNNFIEIYEVHGRMDSRLLDEDPDLSVEDKDIRYVQQMHVVSMVVDGQETKDFTLYKGREKKNPYMITHLIKEDGRTLSIGAVEYLFDAQWMQNHTVKNMKDTLDLASKLIFQTADTTYVGQNILSAIETGDIFVHGVNMPLTRLANDKPDIMAMMNYRQMWAGLGQEITSTPDALRGTTMPSGTPYSLGAMLADQGGSLFEIMTESKGLAIEDMLREYIIPFIKKKMDTSDEIVATLDEQGITEVDALYIPNQAIRNYNNRTKEQILSLQPTEPFNPTAEEGAIKRDLSALGNKRVFKPSEISEVTWKEALKDYEWEVEVEVTNESVDKQAVLATLSTVLQSIASNPAILQDPNAKMVFSKILSETGVLSPLQLSATGAQTPPAQQPMPSSGSMMEGLLPASK
jgi:hypothetical protein